MLRTITMPVLSVVRESDEDRNELRFEFSPEYATMIESVHTDEFGNVAETALEQQRIETMRAASAMLTAAADRSESDLDEATAEGADDAE